MFVFVYVCVCVNVCVCLQSVDWEKTTGVGGLLRVYIKFMAHFLSS